MDKQVNISEILQMIKEGENESVEFKYGTILAENIARNIAAFANTTGGTILVGVSETSGVFGVNPEKAKKVIERALKLLSVDINTNIYKVEYKGKAILVVDVEKKSDEPVAIDGAIYIRKGSQVLPMSPNEIMDAFHIKKNG